MNTLIFVSKVFLFAWADVSPPPETCFVKAKVDSVKTVARGNELVHLTVVSAAKRPDQKSACPFLKTGRVVRVLLPKAYKGKSLHIPPVMAGQLKAGLDFPAQVFPMGEHATTLNWTIEANSAGLTAGSSFQSTGFPK